MATTPPHRLLDSIQRAVERLEQSAGRHLTTDEIAYQFDVMTLNAETLRHDPTLHHLRSVGDPLPGRSVAVPMTGDQYTALKNILTSAEQEFSRTQRWSVYTLSQNGWAGVQLHALLEIATKIFASQ